MKVLFAACMSPILALSAGSRFDGWRSLSELKRTCTSLGP